MKEMIIWQNYDVDVKDFEEFLEEEYPDVTDEYEKYGLCVDLNNEYLEDERANLDIELPESILIIADLGLWNGTIHGAYKELDSCNLSDCFRFEKDCDYAKWYVDKYKNLRSKQSHHDGTNQYLYRMWKKGLSDAQKENFLNKLYEHRAVPSDISRYTESVGKVVASQYGWA